MQDFLNRPASHQSKATASSSATADRAVAASPQIAYPDDKAMPRSADVDSGTIFSHWAEQRANGSPGEAGHSSPLHRSIYQAIGQNGGGTPLDASLAEFFGSSFSTDLSGVRLHTDPNTTRAAAVAGAEAFTYGQDVYLGSSFPSLDTTDGIFVLGHELAHVAQQGSRTPSRVGHSARVQPELAAVDDSFEQEADNASTAAVLGQRATLSSAQPKVRFFAQGDGSKRMRGHAYMTEQALKGMGLNSEPTRNADGSVNLAETRIARMGNWERDISQVITPTTIGWLAPIRAILDIVAIKEFGRGINYSSFGTYDPVEHLDNPAGLRGDDVLRQGPAGNPHIDGSGANYDNPEGRLFNAGGHNEAYADVDARYRASIEVGKFADGQRVSKNLFNKSDAVPFQIDESAVPRYIYTSRAWCIDTLRQAAVEGRGRATSGERHLRGPHMFASGVHVLQDYYAHSNFCEVAINMLIREGGLVVTDSNGQKRSVDHKQKLDSQVHANDAQGNPTQPNLSYANREVISTGTFNLTDTLASLLEEMRDKWLQLDPFAETSSAPSPTVMACLDYLEKSPDDPTRFCRMSDNLVGILNNTASAIEAIADSFGKVSSIAGMGVSMTGKGRGGSLHGIGLPLNKVGFQQTGNALSQGADRTASALDAAGDQIKDLCQKLRHFAAQVRLAAESLKGKEHLARKMYVWLYNHNPLDTLKAWLKGIPKVGPAVVKLLEKAQQLIDKVVKVPMRAGWKLVQEVVERHISSVIGKVRQHSGLAEKKKPRSKLPWVGWLQQQSGNVSDMFDEKSGKPKNGIAPTSYTAPSHTQVAKDHGDLDAETMDGHLDSFGTDAEKEHRQHEHEAGWLYSIAEQLASKATQAVGTAVSQVWNKVDRDGTKISPDSPQLAPIDEAVRSHFAHPADCRETWEPTIREQLRSGNVGGRLLKKLAQSQAAHGQ